MVESKKNIKKEDAFISEFNANPSEKNWDLFKKKAKKDKAKYYYVIFPSAVKDRMNLKKAYAVIYDNKYKTLYKIPIIKSTSKGIEGATINLKDFELNRKAI